METSLAINLVSKQASLPKGKDKSAFLRWDWQPINDQEVKLKSILINTPQPISGFSFATLVGWQRNYRYTFKSFANTTLISCELPSDLAPSDDYKGRHLLQPIGEFPEIIQLELLAKIKAENRTIHIHGVTENFVSKYPNFVSNFDVIKNPAYYNYIYSAQELAELPGRKFQKKRNLVSQAQRAYTWEVAPLKDHVQKAKAILNEIYAEKEADASLEYEREALEISLNNLEKLGLEGIVVIIDSEVKAFSIFECQIPKQRAVIHFEKALKTYKGLYQIINLETAKYLYTNGYSEINREEDMGDEGLKQAKNSYNPLFLEPSYILQYRVRN